MPGWTLEQEDDRWARGRKEPSWVPHYLSFLF